jgi:hypothetical protein
MKLLDRNRASSGNRNGEFTPVFRPPGFEKHMFFEHQTRNGLAASLQHFRPGDLERGFRTVYGGTRCPCHGALAGSAT